MGLPIGYAGALTFSGIGYQAISFVQLLGIKEVFKIKAGKPEINIEGKKLNVIESSMRIINESKEAWVKRIGDQFAQWLSDTKIAAVLFEETPYDQKLLDIAKDLGVKTYICVNWEWTYDKNIDWTSANALIGNCRTSISMLRKWISGRMVYLPPHFDEKEFEGVSKEVNQAEEFGHIMGYGKFPYIEKLIKGNFEKNTWSVFSSATGAGEVVLAAREAKIPVELFAVEDNYYKKSLVAEAEKGSFSLTCKNFASPAQIIGQKDVFVQPSHIEGFGRIPFEAMGCGRPTLTTNWPPMSEICPIDFLLIPVEKLLHVKREERLYPLAVPSYKELSKKMLALKAMSKEKLTELSVTVRDSILRRYGFEEVKRAWEAFFEKELKNGR